MLTLNDDGVDALHRLLDYVAHDESDHFASEFGEDADPKTKSRDDHIYVSIDVLLDALTAHGG